MEQVTFVIIIDNAVEMEGRVYDQDSINSVMRMVREQFEYMVNKKAIKLCSPGNSAD